MITGIACAGGRATGMEELGILSAILEMVVVSVDRLSQGGCIK
jgi:hypothetical protein